jgi:hypothetical protein
VDAGERRSQDRCSTRKGESDGSEGDGSKKMKGMGSNPPRLTLFIARSTQSIRCSSLLHTTCLNGFIPRSQREDQGGFFAKQEDNIRSS